MRRGVSQAKWAGMRGHDTPGHSQRSALPQGMRFVWYILFIQIIALTNIYKLNIEEIQIELILYAGKLRVIQITVS